jgi:pyrroloquinoline quinone biosynthesis protein B
MSALTTYTILLGLAQDGGHPQAGCERECCAAAWADPSKGHRVAALGIADGAKRWLVDATPDFAVQLRTLLHDGTMGELAGILLTHAHIGHYTGLVDLGREVMGAHLVPVYAMPRMRSFLAANGPWEMLERLQNIAVRPLEDGVAVRLSDAVTVTPFAVPHRDEYSETVGFVVAGPNKKVLYLPDIDKWERWSTRIEDRIAQVDAAYVDGTFFSATEIPGRAMAEVPHPFVEESLARFASLPPGERKKIHFVHLNHTNPALDPSSAASRRVRDAGLAVGIEGEKVGL